MRLVEQRKHICILFTFMMLISGMGFGLDAIKADACFLSAASSDQDKAAYAGKLPLTEQAAFAEEQPDHGETINRTAERVNYYRRVKNLDSNVILAMDTAPENMLSAFREAVYSIQWEHSGSAAIISYVHQQDGAKG